MSKMRSRAADIQDEIDNMTDKQIVENLRAILKDAAYQANQFTALVESILNQYTTQGRMSGKQRQVLDAHMQFNARFWF